MRRLVHHQIVMVSTMVHRSVLLMILVISMFIIMEGFVSAVKIVMLLDVLLLGVEPRMVAELMQFKLFHPGSGITVMLCTVRLVFMVRRFICIGLLFFGITMPKLFRLSTFGGQIFARIVDVV